MVNVKKQDKAIDKKKTIRQTGHITYPPRLEGSVKNKMMNPIRKKKEEKGQDKAG